MIGFIYIFLFGSRLFGNIAFSLLRTCRDAALQHLVVNMSITKTTPPKKLFSLEKDGV